MRVLSAHMGEAKKITAGALFSGIGGFCRGFAKHGIETRWAVDWDEHASKTYKRNHANVVHLNADIRDISANNPSITPVDVLHAGFPCQSFSQAGRRLGFDDERGQTFFEIIRLVRELGAQRPKVLVLENSPFLRLGNGGEWYLRVQNEVRKAGYWFSESNAQVLSTFDHTNLPQKRSRLFMIAWSTEHFWDGSFRWPTPLASTSKSLGGFVGFDDNVSEDYYLPRDNKYYKMIKGLRTEDHEIYQLRKYIVRPKVKGVCPTLTANMGKGGHNVPFVFTPNGLRKLTETECARLQGFDESFVFPDDVPRHSRYTQIGNSVAPPIAEVIAKAIVRKMNGDSVVDRADENDEDRVRVHEELQQHVARP